MVDPVLAPRRKHPRSSLNLQRFSSRSSLHASLFFSRGDTDTEGDGSGRGRAGEAAHMATTGAEQSCRVDIVTFVDRSHCVHLNFLKPIWVACSLKHLLQIMSSYFLMRPSWLVQTRQARESLPYFLGWECCWWGIFLQVVCF